jgi:hypothetical protein
VSLDQKQELALKQYDIVVKLVITDTQLYWTRSQLFLVSNTGLAGFALTGYIALDSHAGVAQLLALMVVAITGLMMCAIWRETLERGRKWMDHWEEILRGWESDAFGAVTLYRGWPPKKSTTALRTMWLFLLLWCFVFAYLALRLWLMFVESPSP